jgi:hypothetical protein
MTYELEPPLSGLLTSMPIVIRQNIPIPDPTSSNAPAGRKRSRVTEKVSADFEIALPGDNDTV